MKIFRVVQNPYGDERFCFHAENQEAADFKVCNWCSYHGFDTFTRSTFSAIEVAAPKYADNIHDEWVR